MSDEAIFVKWICLAAIGIAFAMAIGQFGNNDKLNKRVSVLEEKIEILNTNSK